MVIKMDYLTEDDLSFIIRTLVFHYAEDSKEYKQAMTIRDKITNDIMSRRRTV